MFIIVNISLKFKTETNELGRIIFNKFIKCIKNHYTFNEWSLLTAFSSLDEGRCTYTLLLIVSELIRKQIISIFNSIFYKVYVKCKLWVQVVEIKCTVNTLLTDK